MGSVRSLIFAAVILLLLVVGAAISIATQVVLAPFGLLFAAAFARCAGQRI